MTIGFGAGDDRPRSCSCATGAACGATPGGPRHFEWAMRDSARALRVRLDPACRAGQTEGVAPGELALSLARGEGYLGFTRNGWQEAMGVHIDERQAASS